MLGDELDVCRTRLPKRITDVGFYVLPQISEVLRYVTPDHVKRARANHFVPLPARFINVFNKIGILPNRVSNNAHRISLIS